MSVLGNFEADDVTRLKRAAMNPGDPTESKFLGDFLLKLRPQLITALRGMGAKYGTDEDIADETLYRILARLPDWDPKGAGNSFSGWAWRIASNAYTDHVRKQRPLHYAGTGDTSDSLSRAEVGLLNAEDNRRSEFQDVRETKTCDEIFATIVKATRERHRTAVGAAKADEIWSTYEQVVLNDRRTKDVAEEAGLTEAAASVRTTRFQNRLRETAEELYPGMETEGVFR